MSNYEFGPPRTPETITDEWLEGYTLKYGDLCELCKQDVVAEGEDFCRSCLDDLKPEAA